MNTIQYFRKKENDNLRGDNNEGALRIINSLPGTFKIPNIDKEIPYKKVHLSESYDTVLGNIYCLYCISSYGFPNSLDFKIDNRILEFGSHCLMIKDKAYFLNTLENKLKNKGLKYKHGFVHYYDKESVSMDLSELINLWTLNIRKNFVFMCKTEN